MAGVCHLALHAACGNGSEGRGRLRTGFAHYAAGGERPYREQECGAAAGSGGAGQPGSGAACGNRLLVGSATGTAETGISPRDQPSAGGQLRHPPLFGPEVRFLVEDYVPSIKTGLSLPSGARIDLYGLHPKPPPLQDTERRDAELLLVGQEVQKQAAPSIVAGDLNDVAWSRTNSLFQEVSRLLDPRIGRKPYATFNADWPLLRWPPDHVFFEESFRLLKIAVMGDIGSDHFPFFVALCHDPAAAQIQEQPQPESSDMEAAEEVIEDGREEAPE